MIKKLTILFFSGIIAVAFVGYFVGISAGVPQPDGLRDSMLLQPVSSDEVATNAKLIEAVSYAEVASTAMGPTKTWQADPKAVTQPEYDLYTKVIQTEEEKLASARIRASRRAYNGAPPVIPHPVENTNDAACYACHSNGAMMAGLKASVMSHQFLGNCTQCHAPMAPAPFQDVDAAVETSFVGLPAPSAGKRAFPGAPPTIPHSQWMRENCNACHGGPYGWAGMQSTHPWRTNCTQCHAPSAELDQAIPDDDVPMLPPLDVVAN